MVAVVPSTSVGTGSARCENALHSTSVRASSNAWPRTCYGYDEIEIVRYRNRRAAAGGAPARRVLRTVVTTYGHDFGTTNIDYVRTTTGKHGRQSQTWMRTPRVGESSPRTCR